MNIFSINKYIKSTCFDIKYFDTLPSTNTYLKENAQPLKEYTVIVANAQTQGRGRMGRSFFSPKNSGLYFSILLKPSINPENALYFTTLTAVCVSKAIEELTHKKADIKWVNDIYIDGKKVCGILTESSLNSDCSAFNYVVVGVGINVSTMKNAFPEDIKDKAGSIFSDSQGKEIRERLLALILDNFKLLYNDIEKKSFLKDYIDRSFVIGKEVEIVGKDKTVHAIGVDDEFSLIVKHPSGEIEKLSSGEVSIIVK